MRRTRLYRLGLGLAAVFQLLFPTFASVADARAEAASERGARAHVEGQSSNRCVPVHAADCAVCRVLSGGATPGEAPVVEPATSLAVRPTLPQHAQAAPRDFAHRSPSQRAPPVCELTPV